jgi:PAS domain S-box-containing protein
MSRGRLPRPKESQSVTRIVALHVTIASHPPQPDRLKVELDTSPLPTFLVGDDARVVFANEPARLLFDTVHGEGGGAEGLAGSVIGCVEAEKPGGCGRQEACAFCVVNQSLNAALDGRPVSQELARMKLRNTSGKVREFSVRVSVTSVAQAGPRQAILVLEPAADEEIETYLRRKLKATRAILDAVPIPVFVKGLDRRFVYVNREAARALGRDPASVIGTSDVDYFSPEVVEALWAEDDRVLLGGEEFDAEEVFDTLPGGRRIVQVRKRRGTGAGGEPLLLATGADITELKRTQDELQESQRRVEDGNSTLRGVLEAADSAIFSVDRQYRYTCFNRAHATTMRNLYGAEIELGHPLWEYQTVAEDWATAKSNLDRVLGGEAFLTEALSGEPGRSRRHFEVNHAPVRAADGSVTGAAVFASDVSRRRQIELTLLETEDHLRQAQRIEAVGQLAGGIAHDFNNLLTVIMGSADFGLSEAGPDSPLREELQEIRGAGKRAQALTRQLLAFSRRQVLQPQVVDINAKVRDVDHMLGRLLGEHVAVRLHLDPGVRQVFIDPGQLEQVILNLAVNARDAMPAGGTLDITTSNVVLDGAFVEQHVGATAGPQVMLAITDTGHGMDTATMARVFEPFFTTKPKGKGTGLGLATVYGIVKQTGGSIWVYSEPGQGTTFKVYLPLAPSESVALSLASESAPLYAQPGESVLVVEDDDQVRRAAVRCLQRLGYVVTAANGPKEAGRLLEEGRTFTALLTDMVMPGGTGVDMARMVLEKAPEVRIVFMSGYTDDSIALQGVLAPDALFLEKPFTPESLGRKIRQALDPAT